MKSLFIIFVLTYSSLAFKCVLAEGVNSYSTTEKFLEDDRIKHTDWGLWITKFDEAKFDELVWYPTDELIAGLDALDGTICFWNSTTFKCPVVKSSQYLVPPILR